MKINPKKKISMEKDLYKASFGADAIIVLTEWEEYKYLDWRKISKKHEPTCMGI